MIGRKFFQTVWGKEQKRFDSTVDTVQCVVAGLEFHQQGVGIERNNPVECTERDSRVS